MGRSFGVFMGEADLQALEKVRARLARQQLVATVPSVDAVRHAFVVALSCPVGKAVLKATAEPGSDASALRLKLSSTDRVNLGKVQKRIGAETEAHALRYAVRLALLNGVR